MEVTVVGSDVAVWTEVPVPALTLTTGVCPALEHYVPCGTGGVGVRASKTQSAGSNLYILWRIHEESPKSLELIEFSCDKPVHNSGLRLIFESPLCPFASVVLVQEQSNQLLYNATVLTVTGVLYSIGLKAARYSRSRFSMQHESTAESDVSLELTGLGRVTALTATPELLIVGGQSGSIFCFPVGTNLGSRPDRPFELRDGDSGLSRLWGFGFRGKAHSPVKCLTAQSLSGASLLFAVYEDKNLKVWDLVHRNRQFSQSISPPLQLASSSPQSIWVQDVLPGHERELQLALHYGGNPSSFETQLAAVVVCTVHATQSSGGIRVSNLTLRRTFSIGQGNVVGCKMLADKVWVLLKEQGKRQCELLSASLEEDFTLQRCRLQEVAVREQLFQGAGQSWDEFLFALHHIRVDSSSVDDDLVPSLFLRRLLQPGLRQHAALKAVLQARGRYLSDFEIGSLTLDGLRKEIKASIRSEPGNSSGTLKEWMSFCSNYEEAWNTNSVPYGLFADISSGSIGLIRKNSVSVIRTLTLFERLVSKTVTGNNSDREAVSLPRDWDEAPGDPAVLGGLLKCLETVTAHLGQVALGVFHEALLRPASYSLDGLISSFLLILDVGYTPLDPAQVNVAFGVDEIRAKMKLQHQQQRKFALHISQSLQALREAAGSWELVLDVVAKYSLYLVFSTQPALPVANSAVVPLGSAPTKMLAQTACQIAWTHFEAARNLLLLLSYLVKAQGQVGLKPSEVTRIQLNLLPHVQEGLAINLLLHWLTVSFAEVPPSEDCSLQLSSLQIDGSRAEKVQPEMLGAGELALAEILAAAFLENTQVQEALSRDSLPNPDLLHNCAWRFVGWILVGESADPAPVTFSGRAITLSSILLQHGQYGSLERFLNAVEQFSPQQQLSDGIASTDGEWSARLHLLGICSLARAHGVLENTSKEKHIGKAIQCFFRAASGLGEANKVLQTVFFVPQEQVQGRGAMAAWRLQYFEWVMQLFDQYNLSEGACQFAHAALEQVDEAVGVSVIENSENESNVTIKGRLWANVFKFSLDLELYGNAYCAVISNPDEESKDICLRRLIIVLCDHKASLALCGNELPYGGLLSRVEEELVTKAYNSDVGVKAGLFKLLYALHMHHNNVGRAAGYMYEYGMSLRDQGVSKSQTQALSILKEQLDAFAAAINALQLVESADEQMGTRIEWLSPVKRQRISTDNLSNGKMIHTNKTKRSNERRTIDVQHLVKEHALTLAGLQLLKADAKISSLSANVPPAEVVLSLLQHGLYEMAFSLVFLCWKDSSQKKELETVFEVMARKCCLLQLGMGSNIPHRMPEDLQALALVPADSFHSDLEQWGALSTDIRAHAKLQTGGSAANSAWQSLREYLEKYWKLHPNIRAVVADTILSVDRHMELPLWLVNTFKGGKDARGMTSGSWVADPAALLRIYLNHERYMEASYLLLEYLQAATRLRPGDVIKRKQAGGVWFPYTLVDRLLQRLSELHGSDEKTLQSKRLHASLQAAVLSHFDLIKKESDDVRVIAESADFNGPWKGFS